MTWQCHNFSRFLGEEWAKNYYYKLLLKWKGKYGVDIYAYNFMNSHPHLAGRTEKKEGISNLMRRVNCLFAKEFNKRKKRRGQVIMDRFKSPSIENDTYLLNVMIYLDLNPCRAKIVKHPKFYKWSSYQYYACGKDDPLITPSPAYLALGEDDLQRQKIYRDMVDAVLKDGLVKKDYSEVHFIGDPEWVKARFRELNEEKDKKSNNKSENDETFNGIDKYP